MSNPTSPLAAASPEVDEPMEVDPTPSTPDETVHLEELETPAEKTSEVTSPEEVASTTESHSPTIPDPTDTSPPEISPAETPKTESSTSPIPQPESEADVLPEPVVEEPEPEVPPSPPRPKISINLKSPKDKQVIEVYADAAIRDIKATAAEKFGSDPEYLCLIFSGKMMEDDDTLETHNIKEGMTIHLIIKAAPRDIESGPIRPPADISKTPFGIGTVGGLAGLESLGMGSANFMELQNRLQNELLGNPELLRRVLDNPLVQQLMNDSDSMKTLMKSNPQMQDLMHRHPEIKQMLNNPELLKNTAELAKNPSMLQELMRNLDGTNPMEGNTTTFTTLPNLFTTFQGPSLSKAKDKIKKSQKPADPGNIFNNPQMTSLMTQMCEKPQLVQNMMAAPYTQAMLQAMQANPTMAASIITENPLYQGNPQLQQYISSMMPQMIQQLQNPEVLNMMANPQAVNALLQIQEGLHQLKNTAPGLVSNLSFGSYPDFANPSTSATPTNRPAPKPAATPIPGDTFSRYMSQMVASMAQSDPKLPPEERYKPQMEYLKNMGFANEEDNLETLIAVFGDVNAAAQKLLAQNPKVL